MSSAFAARIVASILAPLIVNHDITATCKSVRRNISLFTLKNLVNAARFMISVNSTPGRTAWYLARNITKQSANPTYSPATVPAATPSTFHCSAYTNSKLATRFATFCTIATHMGATEFCIPRNQPENA